MKDIRTGFIAGLIAAILVMAIGIVLYEMAHCSFAL
jgi:preprotein translocase subunit SecD